MKTKLLVALVISTLAAATWVASSTRSDDEDGRRLGGASLRRTAERPARREGDRPGEGASVEPSRTAVTKLDQSPGTQPATNIAEDEATVPHLRGRVVDAMGKPVAGAAVSLHIWEVETGRTRSSLGEEDTTTAADGTFALPVDLSEAPLLVVASDALRGSGATATFAAVPSEDQEVGDIVLLERAVLSGRVEFAGGSPFPRARVVAAQWRNDDEESPSPPEPGVFFRGAPWIETTADDDGRFRIVGCEPGCRYRVMVSGFDACAAAFPIAPDGNVIVAIEMRRLEVRVALVGLDLPRQKVNVVLRSRLGTARVEDLSFDVDAPASAYVPLPESDAAIVVGYGDEPGTFGRASIRTEASRGDVVVDLAVGPIGAPRRLIFTDSKGLILAERLRVEASDVETDYPMMLEEPSTGILDHHLPAGRWRFSVRPAIVDHRAPAVVDLDVPECGETRVALEFEIGGRIALQVDRSRALLETARPFKYGVATVGPDGSERSETFLQDFGDYTGPTSGLWVDNPYKSTRVFPPGRYGLRIRTASGTPVERTVEVRKGETTSVRLEIDADPGADFRFCGGTAH